MATLKVHAAYLAAGANRQTAAADWSDGGLVCYGAGVNLALWRPTDTLSRGVLNLLSGHEQTVKAVRFLPGLTGAEEEQKDGSRRLAARRLLVSGGDDRSLRLWAVEETDGTGVCLQTVEAAHAAPVNCITSAQGRSNCGSSGSGSLGDMLVATGAADATIKIWAVSEAGSEPQLQLLQTIQTSPRYFALCLALTALESSSSSAAWMLAAAGTSSRIQIFTGHRERESRQPETQTEGGPVSFSLQATLSGHEGWIRSLDFTREGAAAASGGNDLLLASASQDKHIRLWRIHEQGEGEPGEPDRRPNGQPLPSVPASASPATKAHRVRAGPGAEWSVALEALLFGHDDWLYSARWAPIPAAARQQPRLLSASADNSLAIWEADADSGIWVTTARLGELSKEKGATTATGSVGGFWTGLWGPLSSPPSVITLCRTGSWRRWCYDAAQDRWLQAVAISGHVAPVTGIAWSRPGRKGRLPRYLLSTSADQTTRLHAQWKREFSKGEPLHGWHEMARPQIHGYDLNCIDTLDATQFVSGADEKLMRVFREPRTVAQLLARMAGEEEEADAAREASEALPEAADMPVLGLSNKAVTAEDQDAGRGEGTDKAALLDREHPPFEDVLSRRTLWPETEKLYGHGYEISCLAASHDGRVVASACRASSLNHAVVRLFETARWTEIRPPLALHALTVTRLRFSPDDRFLLTVGRDRQWGVYERGKGGEAPTAYCLLQDTAKAHSRMILDCAWAGPATGRRQAFATAGRDKVVKIWAAEQPLQQDAKDDQKESRKPTFSLAATLPLDHPVTAVDFLAQASRHPLWTLAVGTETGQLSLWSLDPDTLAVSATVVLERELCLPKAVLQLAWRPPVDASEEANDEAAAELAVAGEDASLRVYRVEGLL